MRINIPLGIRSIGWAILWIIMFPEFSERDIWGDEPAHIASLLMQYFVSGIMLELCYRWLAWVNWYQSNQTAAVVIPECPEHPWISVIDKHPKSDETVEVFCADGNERSGKGIERNDGYNGIVLELSKEDAMKYKNMFWKIRPTHWRSIKQEHIKDDNW